jgi:hypothetical protein
MPYVEQFLLAAKEELADLSGNFLRPLDGDDSLAPSVNYTLFVKSFCVFSHACLEESIEKLSLAVISHSLERFTLSSGQAIDRSIPALICFYSKDAPNVPEKDTDKDDKTSFDLIRLKLEEIKEKHSKAVFENHGVSKTYLRTLLLPVGIDIPKGDDFHDALLRLARWRGEFAHKQKATKIPDHHEVEADVNLIYKRFEMMFNMVEGRLSQL